MNARATPPEPTAAPAPRLPATADAHTRRLAAARARRDAGRRPLPADNLLLGAAREAPNPRPTQAPSVPPPGAYAARLLALLLTDAASVEEAADALGLSETQIRRLIDRLRDDAWWIEPDGPDRFRLLARRHAA